MILNPAAMFFRMYVAKRDSLTATRLIHFIPLRLLHDDKITLSLWERPECIEKKCRVVFCSRELARLNGGGQSNFAAANTRQYIGKNK